MDNIPNIDEMYEKIPEERRKELEELARLSGCETKKEIRLFVVDVWDYEQRTLEEEKHHKSDK